MPKILPSEEIAECINTLNLKQIWFNVFNVVHTWSKDFINYDGHNVRPVHIFILGNGVQGKSYLVKVLHNAISKTLLYLCQDPEN